MKMQKMGPLAGIDNASERDDALQVGGDVPALFLREASNVTIDNGRASMRAGLRMVTDEEITDLWQSPLHGEVFGRAEVDWVKVGPDWSTTTLAEIGDGPVGHVVLNGKVLAAGRNGIFEYDGNQARRMVLDVPPGPLLIPSSGSLGAGRYGVAMAWLRYDVESPLSPMAQVHVPNGGGIQVMLPAPMDSSVTGVRLYLTTRDGGELRRWRDVPSGPVDVVTEDALGAAAQFRHMEPMPTGQFLSVWRGRLLTARTNVLRFSEALAYHVHDPRHGFVQLPQRITFVQPVHGGIWVGQVTHVVFLSGDSPANMQLHTMGAKAPVPGSALSVKSEHVGETAEGGHESAVWLAENGYVIGTPSGQMIETRARRLKGIAGYGATAELDGRLTTVTWD